MNKDCLEKCPYIKALQYELTKPPFLLGLLPSHDSISWKMAERAQLNEALKQSNVCSGPVKVGVANADPAKFPVFRCSRLDVVQ